jgi:hypothetical protein
MWRRCKFESEYEGAMSSSQFMSSGQFKHVGFTDPRRRHQRRRSVAVAQLIATLALVLSIAVAATVVSIGLASARTPAPIAAKVSR